MHGELGPETRARGRTPLAGAALFAGATGSVLFGALGLHRRSGGWRMPLGVLAAMVVAFTISTVFVGPAITGDEQDAASSAPDLDHIR